MRIARATADDLDAWAALRAELWADDPVEEHRRAAAAILAAGRRAKLAVLAWSEAGVLAGFAEAAVRHDYVNGCDASPAAFLEGVYVRPAFRRRGVAAALVAAVEAWAHETGCRELASDAELANVASHRLHAALGFAETERVVFFRKPLDAAPRLFAGRPLSAG